MHEDRCRRFLLSVDADGHHRCRRQPGRAARAGPGGTPCRLGRMRSLAADLHRQLCLPDVPRRLPAGRRIGARQAARTIPKDIARIRAAVQFNSMDLLQAPHTFSGIEIALWDALGKTLSEPVYRLLGYKKCRTQACLCFPAVRRYAAGNARRGRKAARQAGFRATKFGWAGYGDGSAAEDAAHVEAARAGMGAGCPCPDRCRPDLRPGCRGRGSAPAGAREGRRAVARGAFPARCAGGLCGARRPQPEGQDGRRRGLPFIAHGLQPDRLRQGRASSRSIPGASAASVRRRRWPIMPWPRA